jgi:endonuclease/exonuclease/phosphatase family metal-dependent hydrolase
VRRSVRGCAGAWALAIVCAAGAAPDAVTVLVFNIHAGRTAAGVDNLRDVAALIRTTGADIVLLQEVDRDTERSGRVDHVKVLRELTGLHGALGATLKYQGGDYGIATLSRWPIRSEKVVLLPVTPVQTRAGGSTQPRGALVVIVDAPHGPLAIVNTHLDPSRDAIYRAQEVAHLLKAVTEIRAAYPRLLIGGDFNAEPESSEQKSLRANGIRDAWDECGAGDGRTYPAERPVKRIDYLFLVGWPRCTSAAVIESPASDHRPLVVTVPNGSDLSR